MAATIHVNGTATLLVDGSLLGWTVDGVTIDFIGYFDDIYTDQAGPHIPKDVMLYGEEAKVTADLIVYDVAILNKVASRVYDGTPGSSSEQYGFLMAECGGTFPLTVAKGSSCLTEAEGGWAFTTAYLEGTRSLKVGLRATREQCVFRCLPNASGILYTQAT